MKAYKVREAIEVVEDIIYERIEPPTESNYKEHYAKYDEALRTLISIAQSHLSKGEQEVGCICKPDKNWKSWSYEKDGKVFCGGCRRVMPEQKPKQQEVECEEIKETLKKSPRWNWLTGWISIEDKDGQWSLREMIKEQAKSLKDKFIIIRR